MVESKTLRCRPCPLPAAERSDRACAIRLRAKPPGSRIRSRLTCNVPAKRGYCGPCLTGRGEAVSAQCYREMF